MSAKANWTAEQAAAIEARHGEAVVVAGAGSGKTGVLAECVALSVVKDDVPAAEVLAITFTRKAAAEMSERIRKRMLELDQEALGLAALPQLRDDEPQVSTIDSFCQGVVRRNALELGVDPRFEIVDEAAGDLMDRAWLRALDICVARFGRGIHAVLAKYDDSNRSPLRGTIEEAWSRMRSGGIKHPRITVPKDDWDKESVRLFKEVKALANAALADSAQWKEGDSNDKTRDLIQAVADASIEEIPNLKEKVTFRTSGDIKASEAVADLQLAFSDLQRNLVEGLASGDLEILAALLEAFDTEYSAIKTEHGCLDFADLAILSRDLLVKRRDAATDGGEWRPPGAHFQRVFLDESQDVNQVQSELISLISPDGKYFSVGDAAQSIYRFRHAEVSLFNKRAEELAGEGRRFDLSMNFRSKSTILDVVNYAFEKMEMTELLKLEPSPQNVVKEARVELLLADASRVTETVEKKDDPPEWLEDVIAVAWRHVEADAVAERIERLLGEYIPDPEVSGGVEQPPRKYLPSDITILSRSVAGLVPFAEALRARNIAATIEGAGGLWLRPEVSDLVALLAVIGNSRNEERLYQLLYSPMCGISLNGLVVLAAEARSAGIGVLEALRATKAFDADDSRARDSFVDWFDTQRSLAGRRSISDAIEAALVERGYDIYLLGLPGGERRFANVRRMQSVAAEWEASNGADIAAFVREADSRRTSGDNRRDGEAMVEQAEGSEGAVRLTTIHKAKGLQFPVTIVSDLARKDNSSSSVLAVSSDGKKMSFSWKSRVGAKGKRVFSDEEFEKGEKEANLAEEDRVVYVGLTRPEGRLILSGAVRINEKGEVASAGAGNSNFGRMLKAGLFPGLADYVADRDGLTQWQEQYPNGGAVDVTVESGALLEELIKRGKGKEEPKGDNNLHPVPKALNPMPMPVRVSGLSYSGLQTASRCAYRWYAEDVVRMSSVAEARDEDQGGKGKIGLRPADRGTVLHGLLENAKFGAGTPTLDDAKLEAGARDITITDADAEQIAALAAAVMGSSTWGRLVDIAENGGRVAREESFAVALPDVEVPLRGIFDVFATSVDGHLLVVDWKTSDKAVGDAEVEALVEDDYGIQREAYALAALSSVRGGSRPEQVEVVHLYAERPEEPASVTFKQGEVDELAENLAKRSLALLNGAVKPTDRPWIGVCGGCPAKGSLCNKSDEETGREQPPS